MSKRFVDPDRNRKAMRGVDVKLRFAFEWLWQNCDAAGIWDWDPDLFKFECGYALDVEALMKACPRVQRLPSGDIILVDYIEINYGRLKENYNPHKPAFRSVDAHGLTLCDGQIQDLPKTCPSLEEEDEEEGIDEDEGKEVQDRGMQGGKVTTEVWPTFDDFWDAYAKKIDRPKCERLWARIPQRDREAIMQHVPAYVHATPEVKYRRNPLTYLNGKNWNDDELTRQTQPAKPGLDKARATQAALDEYYTRKAAEHAAQSGNRS